MAAQTVQFDVEKGKISVTQLVKKIQLYNEDEMQLGQFCTLQPELKKQAGDTIGILRTSYNTVNLQVNTATGTQIAKLGEMTAPQLITATTNQTTVTADLYDSDAMAFTHKFELMSEYDFFKAYGVILSGRLKQKKDNLCAYAMGLNKTKYTATGSVVAPTGTFSTTGAAGATATRNMMLFDIDQMVKRAKGTTKIAPFKDGDYAFVLASDGMANLRNDGAFIQVANYTQKGDLWTKFEAGRYSNTRFFTETSSLANTVGGTSYGAEGFFLGFEPCVEVMVEPDNLKFGKLDAFGNQKVVDMFWVGGYGIPWPVATAREERIFHYTSL